MMHQHEVFCDYCKRDLSLTHNAIDHRLALLNEIIPTVFDADKAAAFLPMIYPKINRAHHFCDFSCLDAWVSDKEYMWVKDGEDENKT